MHPPLPEDFRPEEELENLPLEGVEGVSLLSDISPEEDQEDLTPRGMSDDEDLAPDQPVFTGLFKPQLFRSLLYKAKNTACLSKPPPAPTSEQPEAADDLIFTQPVSEVETVPVPQMFSDLINKQ
uniref:Uncharacterized protein n=1 Tax=Micrurus surinamensis TaxID=129470 RepID=A0A2D4P8T7_MICSU